MDTRVRRRVVLGAAAGAAVVAAGGGTAAYLTHRGGGTPAAATPAGTASTPTPETTTGTATTSYETRPDITPPEITVKVAAGSDVSEGYVFVATKGGAPQAQLAMINNAGHLMYSNYFYRAATDFRVQQYRGEPVLTFWQGVSATAHGSGMYTVLNQRYQQIASVQGVNVNGDLHEFQFTDDDTALITAYHAVRRNLSAVGGPRDGWVWDGVIQEIDIDTGRLLFDWRTLDHVPISESYVGINADGNAGTGTIDDPYDYMHLNSAAKRDGDYLISSRNAQTAYKVDGRTGRIVWRLGGKKSTFAMGSGTDFHYQHHPRWVSDTRISLFDNHMTGHSRGLLIDLDEKSHRATLHREYVSPEQILGRYQGNVQVLDNGNVFVGWGDKPYFTEFAADGTVLYHAAFGGDGVNSYRAFRGRWAPRPADRPMAAATSTDSGMMRVFVSWNGMPVSRWRIATGNDPDALDSVHDADSAGFETAVTLPAATYVRATALDSDDNALGTSTMVTRFRA